MVCYVCPICNAIPFPHLPSEHLPALPHHPTLTSLLASSRSCELCALIVTAVKSLLNDIDGRNGTTEHEITRGTPHSGKSVSQYFRLMGDDCGDDSEDDQEERKDLLFRQAEARGLRPWLFGNWWVLDEKDKKDPRKLKLLGLGVRLGLGREVERGEGNDEKLISYRGTYLRIRVDDDSPGSSLSSLIPGRLRTFDSGSTLALSRVTDWLRSCDLTHTCLAPNPPPLPTRVLDVGRSDNSPVTLFEPPAGARGRYITLSHCWGESGAQGEFRTTTHNLKDRKCGIFPSTLSKTFQDAITATRYFGIRYLWIDSLCIIQDSTQDWLHESARMADVYSNSYLTISASASRGVESGIFINAKKTGVSHQGIESFALKVGKRGNTSAFVVQDEQGKRGYEHMHPIAFVDSVHVSLEWLPSSLTNDPRTYLVGEFGQYVDPISFQHLSTRAWTLQERVLSPRVIHYATDQMYWECRSCFLGEDGVRISPNRSGITTIVAAEDPPPFPPGAPKTYYLSLIEGYSGVDREADPREAGGWLNHVRDYSLRSLTKPSDKLIALSGLARAIASKTGKQYFAGIWQNHILEDISWRAYTHVESHSLGSGKSGGFKWITGKRLCPDITRPAPYRAPSWSWASVEGGIVFVPIDLKRVRAVIRTCWTELLDSIDNPFGAVEGGGLELKAPFFEIAPAPPTYRPDPKLPLNPAKPLVTISHPTGISYGNAFFDLAGPAQYPCYALFLDSQQALILRRRTRATPLPPGTHSSFDPKNPSSAAPDATMKAGKSGKSRSGLSRILKGFSKEKENEKRVELMEFDRIGVATFIRTDRQRKRKTLGPSGFHARPCGPVEEGDMECAVTVLIF